MALSRVLFHFIASLKCDFKYLKKQKEAKMQKGDSQIRTDKYAQREAEKYERPIPSREFILEYLAECNCPLTYRKLVAGLNLTDPVEEEALRRRLGAMVRDGQLIQNRRGAYGLPDKMDLVAGRVVGHRDGYGFVDPDDGGEGIFISARQMRKAMHGDRVFARITNVDSKGRREGAIVEVTEHNTHEVAGRLLIESGIAFVQPSNTRLTQDILIPPDALNGAQQGQIVIARITTWPDTANRLMGEISEVMGDHMAPGMEIDLAIRNHDIPYKWPEDVLAEAARFAAEVPEEAFASRTDLRHLPFVTIDGEDAKDFDDAVYCEKNAAGWKLYVAIADVSHYVRPGSALDREALNRGNSVYFPGRVIPMLPEKLSNGLCSLNPHVNRLALVCEMQISSTGQIAESTFHEAVFRSYARLTYNKVYACVGKRDVNARQQHTALLPQLDELFTLYQVLAAARKKRGSIDFDLPETRIVFGRDRKIERIVQVVRNDAHRLIEECMLAANISAAHLLLTHDCPGLFRVHRGPSPEKLVDLRKFLGELALQLPGGELPQPRDYAALLATIAERPDVGMIQMVLLRSLSQALYTPQNEGHFGLAFDAYTHFTSPIRRYPDLLVHRAIRSILHGKFKKGEKDAAWEKYGEHCSMTERRADDATREAMDWLKCEYMLDQVGKEFAGVISSVTSFGLFVQLTDVFVEGLVHISQLPNDYYHYEASRHEIIGERSGRRFRLGGRVTIIVARVDLEQRKMDFSLVEDENEKERARLQTKESELARNKAKSSKKNKKNITTQEVTHKKTKKKRQGSKKKKKKESRK